MTVNRPVASDSEGALSYLEHPSERAYAAGLLLLGLLQGLFRFLQLKLGPKALFVDAADVWLPLARQVANGQALYTGTAVDNKPPLFEFLNLAIYLTGHYTLVFTLLIGLANAVSALLVWRLLADYGRERSGAVAALVVLGVLPFLGGLYINVRSLALPFVLLSLLSHRILIAGVSLALAGLFSQYAVLAAPVVLIVHFKQPAAMSNARRFLMFCAAGLATAAFWFGLVGVVYGVEAMVNGMRWSVGLGNHYFTMSQKHSPFHTPLLYAADFVRLFVHLPYVFIPAAFGFWQASRDIRERTWSLKALLATISVLLGLSLFVRSFWLYWILPLPFVVALATTSVEDYFSW